MTYSNSMIEALNKVIKQQFLYPKPINSRKQLEKTLKKAVITYNSIRPQKALNGNTPLETFNGQANNVSRYKTHFKTHKNLRVEQNKNSGCLKCNNPKT